jgi:hypothetical protein
MMQKSPFGRFFGRINNMNNDKGGILVALLVIAAVVAIVGGTVYYENQQNGSEGPGSGDVIDYPEGPGSGDEIDSSEGPGSGDVIDYPEGPGSGDVIDYPEGPGSGDEIDTSERTGPGSGDEIIIRDELAKKVKGSCNAISQTGNCIDYIGSYFSTWTNIQLHCSDPRSTPSKNPCPSAVLGGCREGKDTAEEMIVWPYDVGVESYLPENIGYFYQACTISGNSVVY